MLIFILLAILQKTPRFGSHPFAFSDILSNTSFTQPSNKLRRRLKIWSKTYRVDYRWSLSGASGPFSESSLFISWQPRIHKGPYLKRSIRTNSNLGRIFFKKNYLKKFVCTSLDSLDNFVEIDHPYIVDIMLQLLAVAMNYPK